MYTVQFIPDSGEGYWEIYAPNGNTHSQWYSEEQALQIVQQLNKGR